MSGVRQVVCAVDVGSTLIKAVIYDHELRVLGRTACAFPAVRDGVRIEADLDEIWRAVTGAVSACVAASTPTMPEVLILSSHMASLVLLGESGSAIGRCIMGVDSRGSDITVGNYDTSARTGCPQGPIYPANKLRWLARYVPGDLAAARYIGGVKDYLLYRLTGAWVTDRSSASATGLYDLASKAWWPKQVRTVGVSPRCLARLVASTDAVGRLRGQAAAELSVMESIQVLAGVGDGPAANLSAGAIGASRLCLSVGTTVVARLLVHGDQLPISRIPLFVQHLEADWYCVGVRFDERERGRYAPVGLPHLVTDLDGVPDLLHDTCQHYGVSEIRPVGSACRDQELLHRLARSWRLPVAVTDAHDGTRGLAALAQAADANDPVAEAASRGNVRSRIYPETVGYL